MSYGVTRKVSGEFTAYMDASRGNFCRSRPASAVSAADKEYWTVSHAVSNRFGMTCRECRDTINKGESYVARDGRRIRLVYHDKCFSGDADPRTQSQSTAHRGALKEMITAQAPERKGAGKFSVSSYGLPPASR